MIYIPKYKLFQDSETARLNPALASGRLWEGASDGTGYVTLVDAELPTAYKNLRVPLCDLYPVDFDSCACTTVETTVTANGSLGGVNVGSGLSISSCGSLAINPNNLVYNGIPDYQQTMYTNHTHIGIPGVLQCNNTTPPVVAELPSIETAIIDDLNVGYDSVVLAQEDQRTFKVVIPEDAPLLKVTGVSGLNGQLLKFGDIDSGFQYKEYEDEPTLVLTSFITFDIYSKGELRHVSLQGLMIPKKYLV